MNARLLAAGLIGVVVGIALVEAPPARADVRRGATPQAFSSGAMRSERVLEDIRAILQRMEGSLSQLQQEVAAMRRDGAHRTVLPGGAGHLGGARHVP